MAKLILMSFFCMLLSISSVLGDDLENAYRDQYGKITKEIEELQVSIDRDRDYVNKWMDMHKKTCEPWRYEMRGVCRSILDSMMIPANNLKTNRARMKELDEKRGELKIKLLERYEKLPIWWK